MPAELEDRGPPAAERIGPYCTRGRIGAGGIGVVYEATRAGTRDPVAIKVLLSRWLSDEGAVRRFRAEGLAVADVSHPNLAAVLDRGETEDGTPYLVMERVWGEPLSDVLAREGALEPARAAEIVLQVLGGLEVLHAAGLVHADIKSSNVMVEAGVGGAETVKLIDFGLVAREPLPGADHAEELITGTPHYMAPEVIRGRGVSAASDIYAVGVLLFELLTGALPFAGLPTPEVVKRHLAQEVPPPSVVAPCRGITAGLDRITRRALEKWGARRYASATSFAADLLATLAALPPMTRATCASEQAVNDAALTLDWRRAA